MKKKAAVFLDRDGVLIEDQHYVGSIDRVRVIAGAALAVRRLNEAGVPAVVVTNQAGVARGYFSEEKVQEIHDYLKTLLGKFGAFIHRFYYCPHHPEAGTGPYRCDCWCRKPKPGMLLAASRDLGIALGDSWMIGDKLSDLQAGAQAGCRTVLVMTGYGEETRSSGACGKKSNLNLVGIAADLREAVDWFLAKPAL